MSPAHRSAMVSAMRLALLALSTMVASCSSPPPPHDGHDAHHGHGEQGEHPPAGAHPHGHMHHRFENADEWAKRFDDPARDAWQKPDVVVAKLGLEKGARVADIGSGTGYFAVRLARAVPSGVVYGVDVEPDMARYLRERAGREGLSNVVAVHAPPDDPKLPGPVDVALVVDTVHHIEDVPAYFRKLAASLSATGKVVVGDFKMGEIPVGPPPAARMAPAKLTEAMSAAGLRLVSVDEATLPYQYIATYSR